jgi:putative protein kinase ArgK-like GTPase of G3E family
VLAVNAATGSGVDALHEAIRGHRRHLEGLGLEEIRRAKRLERIEQAVNEGLAEELWGPRGYRQRAERELTGSATPYDVAGAILASILEHVPSCAGQAGDS